MIILDTCVVSESIKPNPDQRLIAWLDAVDEAAIFLSAFTIGELHDGVERLKKGKKRDALRLWLEQLRARFKGRILDFGESAAITWGDLHARLEAAGHSAPLMDSLIAAVALSNEAMLATRNEADFSMTGVKTFNPWK